MEPEQRLFGMPQAGGIPEDGTVYRAMEPVTTTIASSMHASMPTSDPVDSLNDFEDYWGFEQFHTFIMPDGRQTINFKTLTEGDIAFMNKLLKRDVVVEKQTGNARFRMDQSEERRALLLTAVTGWTLRRRNQRSGEWELAPFSTGSPGSEVGKWIDKANPAIVTDLEAAIRKMNPALIQNVPDTIEAIDKQITELTEQRAELVARERGEGFSAIR